MLPPDLQSLIDQTDANEREAAALVEPLDEVAINRAPPSGGWSVAQCIEHLTLMNEFYLRHWPEALAAAARAERGPFRGLYPTLPGRLFVKAMEPPYRMKGKAAAVSRPTAHVAREGLLEKFRHSHETYRHLVRAAAAVDVNKVVAPNALVRSVKMRLSTVLLLIPAHDRRHLWQARQVLRALSTAD